jgi:aspartyl-tRNA(Asn)/glutamyl-tRNA(Gln) amidotransferase subunit A
MDLLEPSAAVLADLLSRGEVSSEEVVKASLERIAAVDPDIHAFLQVTPEAALAEARTVDADRRRGDRMSPLAGIPIAIKDNICTRGLQTTCGSRILENYVSPYDATVIEKIKAERLVIVGKLNMDEFGMGSSTENSAFGPTLNPWDTERVPGGSSGGSAASIAAGEVPWSLGTDTGGSVRQPAAMNGVVGLKPTYGRVSRYGLVAFASSLDQIGVLARDVRDCATLSHIISGHDPRDATCIREPVADSEQGPKAGIQSLRVGIPREYFTEELDAEVETAVHQAIAVLEGEGAEVVEVTIPNMEYAIATYYVLSGAEACSNLARYDGVKYGYRAKDANEIDSMYSRSRSEGFGPEVKRRIMLGTFALSAGYYEAYYAKAQTARRLLEQDFERVFESVDVIAGPTSPTAAFRIGEKIEDPLAMYLMDIYTVPANLAGIPGLSIPCGFTSEGLPIGLQILGRPFDEATILRAAFTYERCTDWHTMRPPERSRA